MLVGEKSVASFIAIPSVTLAEAKKILGTIAKDMSDDSIRAVIANVEILTDIVVAHAHDSIIKSSIDIFDDGVHTDD